MDPRITEILERANDRQRQYVFKRLIYPTITQAAKAVGIHKSTPGKWHNIDELEEAVELLTLEMIPAARKALESLAMEAVQALARGLVRKDAASIRAAEAVLNRIGMPVMSHLDVTSKGQSLTPISFVEIVPPDDQLDDGE